MKLKTQRLWVVIFSGICLFSAVAIITTVFRDNLVFFFSPTEISERNISEGTQIRVGGIVEEGSINKKDNVTDFLLTDLNKSIKVMHVGVLPPMFRENQGIVAEGSIKNGIFEAKKLLTKHDEKYMPPEVAAALKKSGKWKGDVSP